MERISKILVELETKAEESYKNFSIRIIPTQQCILGVRIPELRKIAKRIATENPKSFLQGDKGNIYELIMLEGLTLSYIDTSFRELLPFTEEFLNKVDNWAQIDSTIGNYKNINDEKLEILAITRKWLKSEKEFIVRAGLIILLSNYITSSYLDIVFQLSQQITHKGYYVSMGNAWLIATCMAKYPSETISFLMTNTLDERTHNKAIQKSIESLRISTEHKKILQTLKRKKGT